MPAPSRALALLGLVACGTPPPPDDAPDGPVAGRSEIPEAGPAPRVVERPMPPGFEIARSVYGPPPTRDRDLIPSTPPPKTFAGTLQLTFPSAIEASSVSVACGDFERRAEIVDGVAKLDVPAEMCVVSFASSAITSEIRTRGAATLTCTADGPTRVTCE